MWKLAYDMEDVIDLFQNDQAFRAMQAEIIQYLFNLFAGTDEGEPVLGDVQADDTPRLIAMKGKSAAAASLNKKHVPTGA